MQSTTSRTANRGFASMDAHKQREIARKGGRAAHQKGTAHEFTQDEARAAGRKGGERVSANREHMSRIGRIGGKSSAGRRQSNRQPGGHPGESQSTAGGGNSPEAFSGEPLAQHGGNGFNGNGGQQGGYEHHGHNGQHEQREQGSESAESADSAESMADAEVASPT